MADSDEERVIMVRDIKNLGRRLDDHLVEHKLYNADYEARQKAQDKKHEQNMDAISKLTAATKDVVDAWKVASGIQKFIKWLSGFAVIGAVLAYMSKHFPAA